VHRLGTEKGGKEQDNRLHESFAQIAGQNTNGIVKFICAENGQFLPKATNMIPRIDIGEESTKTMNDKCYENRLFIILVSFSSICFPAPREPDSCSTASTSAVLTPD
jgi:hypothetical protein